MPWRKLGLDEYQNSYRCLEELGKGKFGVVYKVEDVSTGELAAAKHIKTRRGEQKLRVEKEIDILSSLGHKNIVKFIQVFDTKKEMIVVLEYLAGGELFERVASDDYNLTELECASFLRQICSGLEYIHAQDIVHLDLKPENIVCVDPVTTNIKIIDFGLATRILPGQQVQTLCGTPEFLAPEVLNYESIGSGTDMWAVGVITYILLSGLSPFMGDTDQQTFANILRMSYTMEEDEFETISSEAKEFVGCLLVKNRDDRPSASVLMTHPWLAPQGRSTALIRTSTLRKYVGQRRWHKFGGGVRALKVISTMAQAREERLNQAARRRAGSQGSDGGSSPELSRSTADGESSTSDLCRDNASGISDDSSPSDVYASKEFDEDVIIIEEVVSDHSSEEDEDETSTRDEQSDGSHNGQPQKQSDDGQSDGHSDGHSGGHPREAPNAEPGSKSTTNISGFQLHVIQADEDKTDAEEGADVAVGGETGDDGDVGYDVAADRANVDREGADGALGKDSVSDGAKRDDGGTDDGAKAEEENRNSLTRDGERRSFSSSERRRDRAARHAKGIIKNVQFAMHVGLHQDKEEDGGRKTHDDLATGEAADTVSSTLHRPFGFLKEVKKYSRVNSRAVPGTVSSLLSKFQGSSTENAANSTAGKQNGGDLLHPETSGGGDLLHPETSGGGGHRKILYRKSMKTRPRNVKILAEKFTVFN